MNGQAKSPYSAVPDERMKHPPPRPIQWLARRIGVEGRPIDEASQALGQITLEGHRTWFSAREAAMVHFRCAPHEVLVEALENDVAVPPEAPEPLPKPKPRPPLAGSSNRLVGPAKGDPVKGEFVIIDERLPFARYIARERVAPNSPIEAAWEWTTIEGAKVFTDRGEADKVVSEVGGGAKVVPKDHKIVLKERKP